MNVMPKFSEADVKRFWSKADRGSGCWIWKGGIASGYGKFKMPGGYLVASRVAYAIATGDDPGDLIVRHSCDNPRCVNPDHLLTGTQKDNAKDRSDRNRSGKGDTRGPRVTATDLAQIQELSCAGVSTREIARRMSLHESSVRWRLNHPAQALRAEPLPGGEK